MFRSSRKSAQPAYTLLELLLALALTAVVLLIVTTGISVQLTAFDMGRRQVEQVQLARVLLRQIANDLHCAVAPSESTSTTFSSSTDTEDSSDTDTENEITELVDLGDISTSINKSTAGLYGGLDWLRVDVIKAVRHGSTTDDPSLSSSGDSTASSAMQQIESIVYYVVTSTQSTAIETNSTDLDSSTGGLVRRELIRPMAALATERGTLDYQDLSITPLAKNVSAVEFRYHDGSEWVEEWDTETSGSLPKAIEIRLFLPATSTSNTTTTTNRFDESTDACYRLVVSLPMASGSSSTGDESLDSILGESLSELGSTDVTGNSGGNGP